LFESPGRRFFEDLKLSTGFTRDPLEKMYRLLDLIQEMNKVNKLDKKLALKGGTAIQLMYFGLSRLSVDVDLNYVGSIDRDVMQKERETIRKILSKLFREKGYTLIQNKNMYALEQFELSYIGVAGNTDRLKVEINYLERLPLLPLTSAPLSHPFEPLGNVSFQTYSFEEHMAMKTRALLTRGTPRDLYDTHKMMATDINYDAELLRKLTQFYLILAPIDLRTLTSDRVRNINRQEVRANLEPLLKRQERDIDPEVLKENVIPFIEKIIDFDDMEKKFLAKFYNEKVFVHDMLFKNDEIPKDLNEHPALQWRLLRLLNPEGSSK